MTVTDIFNLPLVRNLECEILDIDSGSNSYRYDDNGSKADVISELLVVRKYLLDREYVMDLEGKKLLGDFNEALKQELIRLSKNLEQAKAYLNSSKLPQNWHVYAVCHLGTNYPPLHPVQTVRAKKMWQVLTGQRGDYQWEYDDMGIHGATHFDEKDCDWNDNYLLDEEMTKDMHIIFQANSAITDFSFSILDVLWVRDFETKIVIENDYGTYEYDDTDDFDWDKLDFYDEVEEHV